MGEAMSRHTVSPWEYDQESGSVIAPKCGYQWTRGAPVICGIESMDYGETGANGLLIAAAPELLAALQMALTQNSHDMLLTGGEIRKCEAAIAKATLGTAKS